MTNPLLLYDNILLDGALTASDTATGYSVNNLIDYKAYTKWKGVDSTCYLEIDMGDQPIDSLAGSPIESLAGNDILALAGGAGAKVPDAIGIFNHNLGTIGATVKVYYWDGAAYQQLLSYSPSNDITILQKFTTHSATKFKIEFSGMTAAPEIAIIFLGVKVEFPWRPDSPVIPYEQSMVLKAEISQAGNILGAVIQHKPFTISHKWKDITRTWFSTYYLPFWNYASDMLPFFYAWDTENRSTEIWFLYLDPGMTFREVLSLINYSDEMILIARSIGV